NSSNKTEAKTSYLPISLTLKVKSKLEKITVFAGMGPTMLMAAKGIETFSETGGTAPEAYERETTFKMGLGYHALAGIEYGLTDKVNFIAQLRADQVSIKTDKDELTKYTVDGVDKLSDVPVRYKNTTYLEDDTTDNPSKDTVPAIERAYMVPANNFTLNIGISYGF
ncbi:MAG: hypothetical protein NTW97_10665, partial [Candidatus Krumholzibacteria bacterium]|nr:hypothetical protein [Candidatus Krumholzibacteria bacterium]